MHAGARRLPDDFSPRQLFEVAVKSNKNVFTRFAGSAQFVEDLGNLFDPFAGPMDQSC